MREETRRRICETAEKLRYKPNIAAQALSRKPVNIAVMVPDKPHEVQDSLIKGLKDELEVQRQFNVTSEFFTYDFNGDDFGREEAFLRSAMHTADALIIEPSKNLPKYKAAVELLNASGTPVVTLVTYNDILSEACRVSVHAEVVGKTAAQFLSICGCRKAAILIGRGNVTIHERNVFGFYDMALSAGLAVAGTYETLDRFDLAYERTREVVFKNLGLDGLFVTSYNAPAVCECLKHMGRTGDIKVIGVDLYDKSVACMRDGSLSALICQNQYLQAQAAVEAAVSCVGGIVPEKKDILIKPELVLLGNLELYTGGNS